MVAAKLPADWVRQDFDDGQYHVKPPGLGAYFFEEFFDDVPGHLKKLSHYVVTLDAWQREVSPTVSFPYREVKRERYKPLPPTQ